MLYSEVNITRQAFPWGRAYVIEGADQAPLILPSVTTVLKLVKNEKYEKLREQFGEERWNKILYDAAERGTVMHRMLELFLLEWAKEKDVDRSLKKAQIFAIEESRRDDGKYTKYVNKGRDLFWNFYHEEFWKDIKCVLHNELFLWTDFRGGWAGATDFIFEDFSGNQKWIGVTEQWVVNGPIQSEWRQVLIPLSAFSLENSTVDFYSIKQLMLQFESNGNVFIDNIEMIALSAK